MKRLVFAAIFLVIASSVALADLAPPPGKSASRVKKPLTTTLSIKLDRNATEAKLVIPRSQLNQLRAELDELDNDGNVTAAVAAEPASFARLQTIVSGVLLSLTLVFGGLWFVRSGRSPKALTILTVAGVVSTATFVYANVGPPPEARSITGKIFAQPVHIYKQASGKISVETTTADRQVIELIVPDPKEAPAE